MYYNIGTPYLVAHSLGNVPLPACYVSHLVAKWEHRSVVAWDGEGANLEDGTHIYNLLANSLGASTSNPSGLTTKACLDFCINHADPKAINCIYGGGYDVNMMLVDLSLEQVNSLWTTGATYWKSYRLFYTPRKKFTIQKFYRKPTNKIGHISMTMWDVIGYFQSTFVKACRNWKVGDPELLDEIERMKHERSVFTPDRMQEIKDYNRKECDLLVLLMEALFESLDTADIKLQRYDGAGSIAAALLKKYKVRDHKGEPNEKVYRWSQVSYSGGRIEAPKVGNEECPVNRYDVNSAYPSSCLLLPDYKGAYWVEEDSWDGSDHSLVHIRYHFKEEAPFYPFWYRQHDGSILYPRWGEGIYYGAEIRYPLSLFPDDIEVIGALNVRLKSIYKPFGFNAEIYGQRLAFKVAGNMAEVALKLGMNSEYGKTAQQVGGNNGEPPTYHSLIWAGEITARTRALLYEMAMQDPSNVIAFATDAIMTKGQLSVPTGTKLGEWTHDKFDGMTLVQAGVYWLLKDGDWSDKYRGFDKGSLARDHIVNTWKLGHATFSATLSRFVGMGSALASSDFHGNWRTWPTATRELSLTPAGKRVPSVDSLYWDHLCDTLPSENLNLDVMSKPYPVAWMHWDSGSAAELDYGREVLLEQEEEDSFI